MQDIRHLPASAVAQRYHLASSTGFGLVVGGGKHVPIVGIGYERLLEDVAHYPWRMVAGAYLPGRVDDEEVLHGRTLVAHLHPFQLFWVLNGAIGYLGTQVCIPACIGQDFFCRT